MRQRVGDIEVGYEIHGHGPETVLLIHGLGYARWGWTWQIPDLARDFRVLAFDNRGIGETSAPPGPYSVTQMADAARGLLDALEIEHAHVVGCSLGGMIAQELALAHPDRIDRLVLVCTAMHATEPYPQPPPMLTLYERASDLPPEQRMRLFVENACSARFIASNAGVIERIVGFRLQTAQTLPAWEAQATAGAGHDTRARAGDISAETLVIVGDEDNVLDVRHSRLIADALPNATYVQLPGGHLFFIEQAPRFNTILRAFLRDGAKALEGIL